MIEQRNLLAQANSFVEHQRNKVNPRYRNHYHLMAPVGWINDPNGFIYYRNEYHMFYQYHPYSAEWGPMYWGHAKSKDLIHWEHLPIALAPDQWYDKDGCFSGSAFEYEERLYLMYTGHRVEAGVAYQTQCLAVSADGVHFEKLTSNPVISGDELGSVGDLHDFRDPKVVIHDHRFYALVASKTADQRGQILLFTSTDLLKWDYQSVLLAGNADQGVMWECPDFFDLDGQTVLLVSPVQIKAQGHEYQNISSTVAFIGEMDWANGRFSPHTYHEVDHGLDFYAAQTLVDSRGQRVMMAWMQMWGRTMPTAELDHHWSGSMTLPRELHIRDQHLLQKPLTTIYRDLEYSYGSENIEVTNQPVAFHKLVQENTYFQAVIDLTAAQRFEINFAKSHSGCLKMTYDRAATTFTLSRKQMGYVITGDEPGAHDSRSVVVPLINDQLVIEAFRDTSSIEVFINGLQAMSMTFYEIERGEDIEFTATGQARIISFEIGRVKS